MEGSFEHAMRGVLAACFMGCSLLLWGARPAYAQLDQPSGRRTIQRIPLRMQVGESGFTSHGLSAIWLIHQLDQQEIQTHAAVEDRLRNDQVKRRAEALLEAHRHVDDQVRHFARSHRVRFCESAAGKMLISGTQNMPDGSPPAECTGHAPIFEVDGDPIALVSEVVAHRQVLQNLSGDSLNHELLATEVQDHEKVIRQLDTYLPDIENQKLHRLVESTIHSFQHQVQETRKLLSHLR